MNTFRCPNYHTRREIDYKRKEEARLDIAFEELMKAQPDTETGESDNTRPRIRRKYPRKQAQIPLPK